MPEVVATKLFHLVMIDLAVGGVFAIAFLARGIGRIDPLARDAPLNFKLVILPGVLVFWPLLAWRWLRGQAAPPDERSPHIVASGRPE